MARKPANATSGAGKLPELSLCMIVKNEARTLEKCLSLARPHVDEIVIVDTGSTDGSQEIARKYADTFSEIEWPESFSIARNVSFDLARGKYLMYLDGDEYIENEEEWQAIRQALTPDLLCMNLYLYNLLPEGLMAADRCWQSRVFLNHPEVRFIGKVHNQIWGPVQNYWKKTGEKLSIVNVPSVVVHTGYALDPDQMQRKYEPRLNLLRAEYDYPVEATWKAYYGYQLGVALFIVGQLDEALRVFEELNYSKLSDQNSFYTHLLAAQTAIKLQQPEVALKHSDAMLRLNRIEPVAYFTTGVALMQANKVADGLLFLLEAYSLNNASNTQIRFELNNQSILGSLARLSEKLKLPNYAVAFDHLREGQANEQKTVALIEKMKEEIVFSEASRAA